MWAIWEEMGMLRVPKPQSDPVVDYNCDLLIFVTVDLQDDESSDHCQLRTTTPDVACVDSLIFCWIYLNNY
jgi:hypothetical protein